MWVNPNTPTARPTATTGHSGDTITGRPISGGIALTWTDVAVFLLTFGTVARITRFVNADTLAEPVRTWWMRRTNGRPIAPDLVVCPWCLGMWVSAVAAAIVAALDYIPWYAAPAYAFTLSYLYGLVATRLDH